MDTEGHSRIRLLHVDDHTTVVTPLASRLEALGEYHVTVERDADAAVAALEETAFDAVLLADTVASTTPVEFCRRVRAAGIDCPVLVLTGDPATVVSDGVLDAGATDVVDASSDAFLRLLRQRIRLLVDTERSEGAAPALERLVAELPLGVFVEDETVSYANDAFLDQFGVEDDVGDRSLAELLGPVDAPDSVDCDDPVLVDAGRHAGGDGTLAVWTAETAPREDGVTVGAVWDLDDGTGRLGEFERRHAMLESHLASLPLATSFRDAYGRYVAVSERVTELGPGAAMTSPDGRVHHAPPDLVGKTDHDVFPTPLAAARLEEHEQVLETERPVTDGGGTFDVDGESITFQTVVAPWYDADGNVVGTVDVTMDVSDRARSEHEAVVQREVFDVVGDALAIELREAVGRLDGGVTGERDSACDGRGGDDGRGGSVEGDGTAGTSPGTGDGTDTGAESASGDGSGTGDGVASGDGRGTSNDVGTGDPVAHVRSVADDLSAIVDTVRTATADVEPTELDAVARAAWESIHDAGLSDAGDDTCTLAVETEAVVLAEPEALEELLSATLRNAVESGAESVHVGTRDLGFFVADDGPGIPVEERDRVVEYGYTTKPDAVGSGLTVADLVATAHRWELSIGDSPTGGTRVAVDDVRFL